MLAFRATAQQLAQQHDREPGTLDGTAVLDLGVQDTGPDGGLWALALRGVDTAGLAPDDLVTAWTLRGAPHLYRRRDLAGVAAAVRPFSEQDAAKRIHDAAKPLRAAGIGVLEALDVVAAHLRDVVATPMVKGEVSGRLSALVDPPYLRFCRPCGATHVYELPFRLAALRAGLELRPGTSPPVLQPVPGLVPSDEAPYEDVPQLDVVRGYLQAARTGDPERRGRLPRRAAARRAGPGGRRTPSRWSSTAGRVGCSPRTSTPWPPPRRAEARGCSARSTRSCRPGTASCS